MSDTNPERSEAEAIVVGLGAAGCVATWTLAERGVEVLALDAGPLLDASIFARRVPPAPWWRRLPFGRSRIQCRSVSFHPRVRRLYVDDRRQPYEMRGETFLWIRGRQVGGRLHTWARMSLRFAPSDFTERPGGLGRWPIGYADLEEHYEAVERHFGLAGSREGLAVLPDGAVSEPRELRPAPRLFAERLSASHPELRVIPPRLLLQEPGPVPSPLDAALATGRVSVRDRTAASRLLLDRGGGRIVGLEVVDADGGRRVLRADLYVLAGSTIETVRLLLNSAAPEHPYGLGNDHDRLGRGLMDHHFVFVTGKVDGAYTALAERDRRPPYDVLRLHEAIDLYVPDAAACLPERDFERTFGIQGRVTPREFSLGAFGEMLPDPDNRIDRSSRRDALGVPSVAIRARRGPNDLAMVRAQKRTLERIAAACGLEVAYPGPRLVRRLLWRYLGPEPGVLHLGLGIHELGGAAMAERPEEGVTDATGRVFGLENLYVADGALFPSSGCQNPTLTIMALARRVASLAGT